MRTGQHGRQAGPSTLIATNDVADSVEAGPHAGLFHPALDEFARGPVLRREEVPGERSVIVRNGRELLKPGHDFRAKAQLPRFNVSHDYSFRVSPRESR